MPTTSKPEAIEILERDHLAVGDLMAGVGLEAFARPGTIGGGDWSARDLIGHLTSWEEHALVALEAWARGEPAPIQRALRRDGLNVVNADAVAADRARSTEEVRERFEEMHRRLIAAITELPDADWERPPTPRSRRPLALVLGGIVGGPAGPFAHASAHLPDLGAFVDAVRDRERAVRPVPGMRGPDG